MTENIGPLNREFPPFARMTLNGNEIIHHMDVLDFPEEPKNEACVEHIQEGAASDLLGEFMLAGCHFPKPEEEQMIRTAFVCPGPSMFKKCRLKLIQADAKGKIITTGKII